jgi:hypothetical protein
VGPVTCEITGATQTPYGSTMCINVQHPGETPSDRSDPAEPNKYSKWLYGGRPRSAAVVIRRRDSGSSGPHVGRSVQAMRFDSCGRRAHDLKAGPRFESRRSA